MANISDPTPGSGFFVGMTASALLMNTAAAVFIVSLLQPGEGLPDTGAENGVTGKNQLAELRKELQRHGLDVRDKPMPANRSAMGVGGNAVVCAVVGAPLGLGGNSAEVELLVFEQDLPLLLPNKLFVATDADISYKQRKIIWNATSTFSELRLLPSGHPSISVV